MKTIELINQYIIYRQSLGEKFKTNATVLNHFGRYIGRQSEITEVTKDITTAYLYSGVDKITSIWFGRHGALKGFFLWCISRGYMNEWPLTEDLPNRPEHIVPYIYTNDELRRIFTTAVAYQKNRSAIFTECVRHILMVMYFLGLRVHEVMSLRIKDLDMCNNLVTICESKFYKSRICTFNDTVATILTDFLEWRQSAGMPSTPETHLWLDRKNNPMKHDSFQGIFERIREQAGIKRHDGAIYNPRLHDLRHTFAVNRLKQWYREGKDVQSLLPVLSTYMGHKHLSHTSVYLTMTDGLLKEASDLFRDYTNQKGGGND